MFEKKTLDGEEMTPHTKILLFLVPFGHFLTVCKTIIYLEMPRDYLSNSTCWEFQNGDLLMKTLATQILILIFKCDVPFVNPLPHHHKSVTSPPPLVA
jgi:hypothetical protein